MMNDESNSPLKQAEEREKELRIQVANLKKELDDLTYAISHDLRAPLRAVHGFSDALNEDYADKLDSEAKRYISIITGSSKQLTRMIEGILNLSRTGRQPLQVVCVPMRAVVEGIVAEIKMKNPDRKLDFAIGDLPDVEGDHAALRNVWNQLLLNALKFTIPKPEGRIEAGTERNESETIYFVRDNGVGFDMKYEPKLFGLFQRFHTEAEFEGIGVGLALVRRLVSKHGGRVWAESKIGEGSTFYFSLPHHPNKSA